MEDNSEGMPHEFRSILLTLSGALKGLNAEMDAAAAGAADEKAVIWDTKPDQNGWRALKL